MSRLAVVIMGTVLHRLSEINTDQTWYGTMKGEGEDYIYDESAYGLHGVWRC